MNIQIKSSNHYLIMAVMVVIGQRNDRCRDDAQHEQAHDSLKFRKLCHLVKSLLLIYKRRFLHASFAHFAHTTQI